MKQNPKESPANATTDTDKASATSDVTRLDPLRQSRISKTWVALASFAVLLFLITDFVLQNTNTVTISFLGWDWKLPLAVALMVAVASGILITSLAGTIRMVQIRRRVRKDRKKN